MKRSDLRVLPFGCDLVLRDSRAAEVAELRARLQELERAA